MNPLILQHGIHFWSFVLILLAYYLCVRIIHSILIWRKK